MFNSKTELSIKEGNYVVTTKESSVWFFKALFLWNKKTIIHEREKGNRNTKIFWSIFENLKNRNNI